MKTHSYPTYLCLFCIVITLFTACAIPQPVSRLMPVEENTKWWYGRELIEVPEERGVAMDVVFQKSTSQYLILDVSIQNYSGETVLVDPLQFSMAGLGLDTLSAIGSVRVAIDPEFILLNLDRRESREIAERQNSASLELLSMTLDAASDISAIGSDKDPEIRAQELEERDARRADYEVEQANRDYRLGSLADERQYWETATIRKTSLDSGYELKGVLFFPRQNDAAFLRFKGIIGQREFQVLFRQWIFQP